MTEIDTLTSLVTNGIDAVISIVMCVLTIIGMWKIFTKAGEEGWKSLIPYYNVYVIGKIVKRPSIAKARIISAVISAVFLTITVVLAVFVIAAFLGRGEVPAFGALVLFYIILVPTIMIMTISILFMYLLQCFLIEAFDVHPLFILLFIFFPGIAYLIIGLSNKYQYKYRIETPYNMNGGNYGNNYGSNGGNYGNNVGYYRNQDYNNQNYNNQSYNNQGYNNQSYNNQGYNNQGYNNQNYNNQSNNDQNRF